MANNTTKINQNFTTECVICLGTIQDSDVARTAPCLHVYYKECATEWLRRKESCAYCRRKVTKLEISNGFKQTEQISLPIEFRSLIDNKLIVRHIKVDGVNGLVMTHSTEIDSHYALKSTRGLVLEVQAQFWHGTVTNWIQPFWHIQPERYWLRIYPRIASYGVRVAGSCAQFVSLDAALERVSRA